MLYSFYKWMFSIRGKKVVRLRHRLSRSKIFKQAPDSVLSGTRNLADSPKDLTRRILKVFRVFFIGQPSSSSDLDSSREFLHL